MHRPNPSRRAFAAVLAAPLLFAAAAAAALPAPAGAATKPATRAVASPAALLPTPFRLEQQLKVDLDKDGDLDVAMVGVDGMVPAPETMEDLDEEGNRVLVIARKDADGYRSVGIGRDALMCRTCGGAFWGVIPAPIELSASKGVLVVDQSAGSRELTEWTHRYRIEAGRVRLIGTDRVESDRATGAVVTRSTNLLTGVTITTVDGEPEQPATAGTVKGRPRIVLLENVTLD